MACLSIREPKTYKIFMADGEKAIISTNMRFSAPQDIDLFCYCNTPQVEVPAPKDALMENIYKCACKERVHAECLSVTLKDPENFLCASCTANVITPGVTWSEPPPSTVKQADAIHIGSTCPVDNFLTYATVFEKEQNKHFNSHLQNDTQSRNLHETLKLVKQQKFNAAQGKYYNELVQINADFMDLDSTKKDVETQKAQRPEYDRVKKINDQIQKDNDKEKKKNPAGFIPKSLERVPTLLRIKKPIPQLRDDSMWGTIEERVNAKHRDSFTVTFETSCDNDQCQLHPVTAHSNLFHDIIAEKDVSKIGNIVTEGQDRLCDACNTGTLRTSPLYLPEDNWGLSIHLSSIAQGTDELDQAKADIYNMKIPQKITFQDGKEYGLAAVTFAEIENHFTSAIWIPSAGEFVWYDGLDRTKKIRKCNFQADFMRDISINSLEYLRLG